VSCHTLNVGQNKHVNCNSVIPDPVLEYGASFDPGSSLFSVFLDSGLRRNDISVKATNYV